MNLNLGEVKEKPDVLSPVETSDCWLCDVYGQIESLRQNYEAVKEENRLLREQFEVEKMKIHELEAKNAKIESLFLTPPNYSQPTVKNSPGFTAEENGWVSAVARCYHDHADFYVNDSRIGVIIFAPDAHSSVFYPVRKGDRCEIIGGTLDGSCYLNFYPYLH
jgi:hypothetical protein